MAGGGGRGGGGGGGWRTRRSFKLQDFVMWCLQFPVKTKEITFAWRFYFVQPGNSAISNLKDKITENLGIKIKRGYTIHAVQ